MDNLDVVEVYAKRLGHELRERGLVSLPVTMGPGQYRHRAGRIYAYRPGFVKPGAGAECSGNI